MHVLILNNNQAIDKQGDLVKNEPMTKQKTKAKDKEGLILGIETSCDETGLALVKKKPGKNPKILKNLIFSQEEIHRKTGGVVPEIAARKQVEKIFPLLKKLKKEELEDDLSKIGAVAVTYGPGLVGSLLVGLNLAKTLSFSLKKPLIAVNHLKAHLYSGFLTEKKIKLPAVGLIASGGHTTLVLIKDHTDMETLGSTRDDAAGEAFDKVAKLLQLGYPGGPAIEKAAQKLKTSSYHLPRPLINKGLDFSFSGLKTAVLRKVKKAGKSGLSISQKNQLAFEFQEAVVDILAKKLFRACQKTKAKTAIIGGGVTANQRLKEKIKEEGLTADLVTPTMELATDNGAMVASYGSYLWQKGITTDWQKLEVEPNLSI